MKLISAYSARIVSFKNTVRKDQDELIAVCAESILNACNSGEYEIELNLCKYPNYARCHLMNKLSEEGYRHRLLADENGCKDTIQITWKEADGKESW